MKVFTAAFKRHVRKAVASDRDFNKFYRRALRKMEYLLRDYLCEQIRGVVDEDVARVIKEKSFSFRLDIERVLEEQATSKVKKDMQKKAEAYFAVCWRDDDCPSAEKTFGVCRLAT